MKDQIRFLDKVKKTEACWLWNGHVSRQGYGRFYFNGKAFQAHRASYLLFRCDIDPHMDICHRCDVRNCVNPDHLFVGSRSDNMRDCVQKKRNYSPMHNKTKTHCPHGHEYTTENTWTNAKGWRWCKTCNNIKASKRYHAGD